MNTLAEEIVTAPGHQARETLMKAEDAVLVALAETRDAELTSAIFRSVDQRLANRLLALMPRDAMRLALERAASEATGHLLAFVQPTVLSELLSQASNELVEKLVLSARSSNLRHQVVKALPAQRQTQWKKLLREKEQELEQIRRDATEGQASLLEERRRLLDEINAAIHARERVLQSVDEESRIKQQHFERTLLDAQARLATLEDAIAKRQSLIESRERELAAKQAEFEELNRRQVQQKIEAKVPEYVSAALKVLEEREQNYRRKAAQWTLHGTVVLLCAIATTLVLSFYGFGATESMREMSWQTLLFVSFKGLVVLGVLGLWAKHAFTLSNAYMHEAIKRSDRAHAITFGKLYLEIYGNAVDKKELLEIFENWNITSESPFSRSNPGGFEPQILEKLGDIAKLSERSKSAG